MHLYISSSHALHSDRMSTQLVAWLQWNVEFSAGHHMTWSSFEYITSCNGFLVAVLI